MMEIYGTINSDSFSWHIPGFQRKPLPSLFAAIPDCRTAPYPPRFSLLGCGRDLPAEPNERDQREKGGQQL